MEKNKIHTSVFPIHSIFGPMNARRKPSIQLFNDLTGIGIWLPSYHALVTLSLVFAYVVRVLGFSTWIFDVKHKIYQISRLLIHNVKNSLTTKSAHFPLIKIQIFLQYIADVQEIVLKCEELFTFEFIVADNDGVNTFIKTHTHNNFPWIRRKGKPLGKPNR